MKRELSETLLGETFLYLKLGETFWVKHDWVKRDWANCYHTAGQGQHIGGQGQHIVRQSQHICIAGSTNFWAGLNNEGI